MNHKVNSVQALHDDAYGLYNNVVVGSGDYSADTIIMNLSSGIQILKGCWEGKDAGTQINNVITVYNAMIGVRNALAALASESSKVASNYREIQNSNGAGLEDLNIITYESKVFLDTYTDEADTIDINAEVNKNASPKDHIRFLSFIPINILIKNNNTHIAHGLNPSTKPINIALINNGLLDTTFFKLDDNPISSIVSS